MAESVATSVVQEPSKIDAAMVRQLGNADTHDVAGKMPSRQDLASQPSGPVAAAAGGRVTNHDQASREAEALASSWGASPPSPHAPRSVIEEVDEPRADEDSPSVSLHEEEDADDDRRSAPIDAKSAVIPLGGVSDKFHEGSVYGEAGRQRSPEEEAQDKISYLHDIDMLARELKVYNPPQRMTMRDDVEDIRFERDRLQLQVQAKRGAQAFKGGIKFTAMFLEIMNDKVLRGAVPIKGLHQEICRDMRDGKYDSPLTRIYKKHFRRSSTSPEMELGLLMGNTVARVVGKNLVGKQGFKNFLEDTDNAPATVVTAPAPVVQPPAAADVPAAQTMAPPTAAFMPPAPVAPPKSQGPSEEEKRQQMALRARLNAVEKEREIERSRFAQQMQQMGRMAESLGERQRQLVNEVAEQKRREELAQSRARELEKKLEERDEQERRRSREDREDREDRSIYSGSSMSGEEEDEDEEEEEEKDDASVLEVYDDKKKKDRRKSPPLKLNM